MEQTPEAMENRMPIEETPAATDLDTSADPQREFEALKGDYEALILDIRRIFQAIKQANYGQKVFHASRERIRQKPLVMLSGAFAVGIVLGILSLRR
jgi:ElaB/YqjD/DUF883 family membrane-anchored ribosome-binding protein